MSESGLRPGFARLEDLINNFHRGDIYYISKSCYSEAETGSEQRGGRPGIIVSNEACNRHSENVTIVYLTTQPKKELPTHVDITSGPQPSIALCENVTCVNKDRIGKKCGKVSPQEQKAIDAALKVALSLEVQKKLEETAKAEEKQPAQQTSNQEPDESALAELYKLRAQIEVYKGLYENLLKQVLYERGGN